MNEQEVLEVHQRRQVRVREAEPEDEIRLPVEENHRPRQESETRDRGMSPSRGRPLVIPRWLRAAGTSELRFTAADADEPPRKA